MPLPAAPDERRATTPLELGRGGADGVLAPGSGAPYAWTMDARGLSRLRLAGAAAAGAAVAHTLLYLVAVPDTKARAMVLAESGHGYWSWALAAALVLGVVSAVATVGGRFRRGLRREAAASWSSRSEGDPLGLLAARLAALQVGIYLVQELLERLMAGLPLATVAHEQFLLMGLPVQVLVAVAVATVLVVLGRAAEAVGRALSLPPPPSRRRLPVPRPVVAVRAPRPAAGAAAIRAPPAA
jgi:hypothetical protein